MNKALVTGANGFVGSHLVRALLAAGIAVRAFVRPSSRLESLEGLDVEVFPGDLLDSRSIREALEGCDVCCHLAAAYSRPDPAEIYRVNVEGTRAALRAARDAALRAFLYASTIGTLRGRGRAPARETDSHLPPGASPYVRSKYEAEILVRSAAEEGLPAAIAHLAAPVGSWDWTPTVTGRRILAVLAGSMPPYARRAIHHAAVRDVAAGFILAAKRGEPGKDYIFGRVGGNLTRGAFVRLVATAAGIPPPRAGRLDPVRRWLRRLRGRQDPGVPEDLSSDPSWSVAALGLPQSPLEEAFAEAVRWFRSRGMA